MARKKYHRASIFSVLSDHAAERGLEFKDFSPYHMRLTDPGLTEIDCWTTERYYVRKSSYHEIAPGTLERGGEKGFLPDDDYLPIWLDKLFYPGETP